MWIHSAHFLQTEGDAQKYKEVKPYSHISTVAPLSILTDNLNLPARKIPPELHPYMR